ncbi:hypothetical protein [Acetobacter conturbans]|uniref:hypothetical protein n=1 Tax=Acetobacter conturbans TaxID=1737472 RepID=UPI001568FEA5|nr:hypothetical protein [Acetobacter conturbans]
MTIAPLSPPPRRSVLRITLPVFCAFLAGCQHRDLVDTTVDWYHQHEGGLIAQQRPPAPGQFAPYPKIGLTPTTPPAFPSPELRQSITSDLVTSRNLTQRTAAQNGTLMPDIPPPPASKVDVAKPTPPPASAAAPSGTPATLATTTTAVPAGGMGAILDAADSPPPSGKTTASASSATKTKTTPDEPEIAMPDFRGDAPVAATEVTQPLPEIPAGPPPPPTIAGVVVPSDAALPGALRPDYDLSQHDGMLVSFQVGSDQFAPNQDGTLAKLVSSRGTGSLFLHCSGETVSLSPDDQTHAVELGLLRCRTLADALIKRSVPASALHITSSAFGPGARVSTQS